MLHHLVWKKAQALKYQAKSLVLVIGQPVNFQFFGSTTRRDDEAGTHLDHWAPEELEELPEIQVTLPVSEGRREGEVVPVTLASRVTELRYALPRSYCR